MNRISTLFKLSLFAMLIAILGAACSSSTTTTESTVAATVNGKKIMLAEVERLIHQQAQGEQSNVFSAPTGPGAPSGA